MACGASLLLLLLRRMLHVIPVCSQAKSSLLSSKLLQQPKSHRHRDAIATAQRRRLAAHRILQAIEAVHRHSDVTGLAGESIAAEWPASSGNSAQAAVAVHACWLPQPQPWQLVVLTCAALAVLSASRDADTGHSCAGALGSARLNAAPMPGLTAGLSRQSRTQVLALVLCRCARWCSVWC